MTKRECYGSLDWRLYRYMDRPLTPFNIEMLARVQADIDKEKEVGDYIKPDLGALPVPGIPNGANILEVSQSSLKAAINQAIRDAYEKGKADGLAMAPAKRITDHKALAFEALDAALNVVIKAQ